MKLARWTLAVLLPAAAYWAALTEPWKPSPAEVVLRSIRVPRPAVEPVPMPLPKTLEPSGY